MTDPNTNPSNDDEDQYSAPPAPDLGQPQEMFSGMELGVNPEEFFQVKIDIPPSQHQRAGQSDVMMTGNQQPDQPARQPPPVDDQLERGGPTNGSTTQSAGSIDPSAMPSASRPQNDFFDQSGRTAPPGVHTSQLQALPPEARQEPQSGYSFSTFLDGATGNQPNKPVRSNDPYAFFDSASAGTVSGTNPGEANSRPAQPQSNVYSGGLTAEQAFFFGGDNPLDQPSKAQQPDSTFQSFYQTTQASNQEAALQSSHKVDSQQPDGWGPAHLPPSTQPDAYPKQEQANTSNQAEFDSLPLARLNLIEDRPKADEKVLSPPDNTPPPAEAPKPKRRRFTEPDKGVDFTKAAEPQQQFPSLDKLITPETTGILMFALYQIRQILKSPKDFFHTMPHGGNIAEPALFLVICAVGSGLLAGCINFNLLITFQFAIGAIISALMLSFSAWKCYGMMGSLEPFEANFRVIAYSQAALIIAGIQLNFLGTPIPGYATLFISIVLSIRLQLIGMASVHQDLPSSKLFPVLLFTTIFIMVLRIRLGLI